MSEVCKHGSLRRSCEICERDERIKELEWILAGSRDRVKDLKARIAELENFIKSAKDTLDSCIIVGRGDNPAFVFEYSNEGNALRISPRLTRYVVIPIEKYGMVIKDEDGKPIGVNQITEEQIDRAWEVGKKQPEQHVNGFYEGLWALGIVACSGCGGSKEITSGFAEDRAGSCPACHRNGKSHGWVWATEVKNEELHLL